jgi:hypothetical protein
MINDNFWHGILLKLSFKPEKIKRTQAALLYVALRGEPFTADEVPKEIYEDNTTSGCAVRILSGAQPFGLGLIEPCGLVRSKSKSRHGAIVRQWRLADGAGKLAMTWLVRNGFDLPKMEPENELALHLNSYKINEAAQARADRGAS